MTDNQSGEIATPAERGGAWPRAIVCGIFGHLWSDQFDLAVKGWDRYEVRDCRRCGERRCMWASRRDAWP